MTGKSFRFGGKMQSDRKSRSNLDRSRRFFSFWPLDRFSTLTDDGKQGLQEKGIHRNCSGMFPVRNGIFRKKIGIRLSASLLAVFLAGCGGGGSGSNTPPAEILYVLSEKGSISGGLITEYAINPSNGSLYQGSQTITTGTNPIQFLFDPNGAPYAFVLNNGSNTPVFAGGILTGDGSSQGSIQVFSVGSQGLSQSPLFTPTTVGESPVSMAIDSQGQYLVVADHGNGTSGGGLEIFQIGSNGSLSAVPVASSPCSYPNKVLFAPPTDGTVDESLYIVCSSPEISSTQTPSVIYGTISQFKQGNGFAAITLSGSITSASIFNLSIDPSGQYVVFPGQSSSGGFVTEFPNKPAQSSQNPSTATFSTPFVPAGQMAFVGSSSSENVLVGNYDVTSNGLSSTSNTILPCSVGSSGVSCPGTPSITTSSLVGPIALETNSAGTAVYAVMTQTAVTANSSPSTSGSILPYSVSGSTLASMTPVATGDWPLSIAFDSNGNHAFVPNYGSGSVSVFSVGANGALSPLNLNNGSNILSVGANPISVIVR